LLVTYVRDAGVAGSNPATPTISQYFQSLNEAVAQLCMIGFDAGLAVLMLPIRLFFQVSILPVICMRNEMRNVFVGGRLY